MSIEGSKPRKHIRKIRYNNPTLTSFNVNSLFNPELFEQKQKMIPEASIRTPHRIRQDILEKAKAQFESSRILAKQVTAPSEEARKQTRLLSSSKHPHQSPSQSPSPSLSSISEYRMSPKSNYFNTESIRRKQMHGYNILSGF